MHSMIIAALRTEQKVRLTTNCTVTNMMVIEESSMYFDLRNAKLANGYCDMLINNFFGGLGYFRKCVK